MMMSSGASGYGTPGALEHPTRDRTLEPCEGTRTVKTLVDGSWFEAHMTGNDVEIWRDGGVIGRSQWNGSRLTNCRATSGGALELVYKLLDEGLQHACYLAPVPAALCVAGRCGSYVYETLREARDTLAFLVQHRKHLAGIATATASRTGLAVFWHDEPIELPGKASLSVITLGLTVPTGGTALLYYLAKHGCDSDRIEARARLFQLGLRPNP